MSQPTPGEEGSSPADIGPIAPLNPLPSATAGASKSPSKATDSAAKSDSGVVKEVADDQQLPAEDPPQIRDKVRLLLVGKPLDLKDHAVYQHISLVAFLAWVGLGADGLSSSCYGPSEAFAHLYGGPADDHRYLAILLALATIFTVGVISACYSQIIELFPSGGGGYLVASKMLGSWAGALAGCALIVDYVLTVTVSIAVAGDAIFGLLPSDISALKVPTEVALIIGLIILNLRGVKESISILMPIFLTFLFTHAILIFGVLGMHITQIGERAEVISQQVSSDWNNPSIGPWIMLFLLMKAYSLGAGTYTGIEAVSNSMAVMREPRVQTAQRTMIYMAISLAITAAGLMFAYLLLDLKPEHHVGPSTVATAGEALNVAEKAITGETSHATPVKTMNHRLTERFVEELEDQQTLGLPHTIGFGFVLITVLSEGALLVVAAQAGFIGGPKCLATMAHDSWVPHWFGSLSERLSSHNGILLIGVAAILALWMNDGNVSALVIMYSINVFLTFSLSMLGMSLLWWQQRGKHPRWRSRLALFGFGAVMCVSILVVTVCFKFVEGGWITVIVTSIVTITSLLIRRYYRSVTARLKGLDESLTTIPSAGPANLAPCDPDAPTAAILVGGYSGLGVHTLLNAVRTMPGYFKNMVFISVGVVDAGNFKGAEEMEALRKHCEGSLEQYVDLARRLGFPARGYMTIGTDVVDELEQVCRVVNRDFPRSIIFAGQLVFQRDSWYGHLLHNQTAYSLQRRLQWDGVPMVILPTRVRG